MVKRRNLSIVALLSCLLVLVGYGAINQFAEGAPREMLLRSGVITMSSPELIQHVIDEKIAVYWLGPLPGYRYTIICKDRREIIVSYIPEGVSLNHPDRYNLTVETYDRSLASEERGLSSLATDRDDFVASDGTVGTVHSPKPQMVTLAIPGTQKVVEIQYPDAQRIYDVYRDAEHLRLISESRS